MREVNKKAGRPVARPAESSYGKTAEFARLSLDLPHGFVAELRGRAIAAGLTMSSYVRQVLRHACGLA